MYDSSSGPPPTRIAAKEPQHAGCATTPAQQPSRDRLHDHDIHAGTWSMGNGTPAYPCAISQGARGACAAMLRADTSTPVLRRITPVCYYGQSRWVASQTRHHESSSHQRPSSLEIDVITFRQLRHDTTRPVPFHYLVICICDQQGSFSGATSTASSCE